jgi:hypothetical protein
VQLLLANPDRVAAAMERVQVEEISHSGLQQIVDGLYTLQKAGAAPELDELRIQMDHGPLLTTAMELMEIGRRSSADVGLWFEQIVAEFESLRTRKARQQLKSQLTAASDHETELELLRKLQSQAVGSNR